MRPKPIQPVPEAPDAIPDVLLTPLGSGSANVSIPRVELARLRAIEAAAHAVVSLWDDPSPYDAATTRAALRAALASSPVLPDQGEST